MKKTIMITTNIIAFFMAFFHESLFRKMA